MSSGLISSVEDAIPAGYRAVTERAGFAAWAPSRLIRVSGAEAAEYLQGQLTNDIEALAPGRGCYAALLDRKGHMRADMRVLRLAGDDSGVDEIWIELDHAGHAFTLRHLGMYKIGRDAEIEDLGSTRTLIRVEGPATGELLGIPAGIGGGGATTSVSEVTIGGATAHAVVTERGVDLIVGSGQADTMATALEGLGLDRVDPGALEVLRVERGIPRFGLEMDEDTIPQEAGINDRAVSFTKGCYIGQETVARLHYKGKPNRHLRGLRLSGDGAVATGDEVRLPSGDDGEPGKIVGRIGTVVDSPGHGRIALAILRREAEPDGAVVVGNGGEAAAVVALPFGS